MSYETEYTKDQLKALNVLDVNCNVEQILFGGSAGGGKSLMLCDWQICRRLKYPGTVGLLGREELKKLQLSTMQTFWRLITLFGLQNKVHFTVDGLYHVIKFYNKSQIFLMDMSYQPGDPDYERFGSIELTDYGLDEVSEIASRAVDMLDSRVRYKLPKGRPKGMMSCIPAKGWLYNDYYALHRDGILPPHRAFVQALGKNNPHLPQVYLDKLARLPEADRKRLLDGDWDYDDSQDILFQYEDLQRMFRPDVVPTGEKYITVDVARLGKDTTRIGLWTGRNLENITTLIRERTNIVEDKIKEIMTLNSVRLSNVVADEDGIGGGVVDHLRCVGFMNGSRATQPDKFPHKKAECYYKLSELVEQNLVTCNPNLKERNEVIKQLDMVRRANMESDGKKLTVTSKEELQNRHGISPDLADMIMMRMHFELIPNYGKYSIHRR